MISKVKIKSIRALKIKKNRYQEHLFVAESPKIVNELLAIIPAKMLVHTSSWTVPASGNTENDLLVTDEELQKVSFLQHPQDVLGVFPMFSEDKADVIPPTDKLSLALDDVQDPGNLGTIIRIADWFGIENIYCSTNTADVYNPKVVQATMGSLARVKVHYTDLKAILSQLPKDFPVYGTLLDGENIYNKTLTANGIIVMGNEGNGISPGLRQMINRRLLIPSFMINQRETAESLNVAIATAITCAEFRRQIQC